MLSVFQKAAHILPAAFAIWSSWISWCSCWCFQNGSIRFNLHDFGRMEYRAKFITFGPNVTEESFLFRSERGLYQRCINELKLMPNRLHANIVDNPLAKAFCCNRMQFVSIRSQFLCLVMTIVISQLYLIGFNTTCDFQKSQFADGLSCISLQQSHNLSSVMCIFFTSHSIIMQCFQNDFSAK